MPIEFAPAVRDQVKARIALIGPPGSGKTIGALNIARAIGGNWYGIDTEHDRMKLYADRYEFQHGNLKPGDQTPEGYQAAIAVALQAGADGIILDSFSHEWLAILEEADRFSNWKDLTPRHKACIETLINAPAHVIVTMRAKVKYEVSEIQEGGRKKQRIERIGTGPVQREGVEYEFDIIGYLDETHEATFLNRCDALVGKTMPILADPPGSGPEAVPIIVEWLSSGELDPKTLRAPQEKIEELRALLQAEKQPDEVIEDSFRRVAARSGGVLTLGWVEEKIQAARARAAGEKPKDIDHTVPVPHTWAEIGMLLTANYTAAVLPDFESYVVQAAQKLYGKPVDKVFSGLESTLNRAELATLLQKACGASVNLVEAVEREFPPPSRAEMTEAWETVVGEKLPGPEWRMDPTETERTPRVQEPEPTQEEIPVA